MHDMPLRAADALVLSAGQRPDHACHRVPGMSAEPETSAVRAASPVTERPADLYGFLPLIRDSTPSLCDGDCPPWWLVLALHIPHGGCTPMTVMWLHRWHMGHQRAAVIADVSGDGVLH